MYYKLDNNGFYLGLKRENAFEDGFQTNVTPIGNFVKGKFDFELNKWVEGATQEEIIEHRKLLVPFSVTKRQLRQALILSDFDLSLIDLKISQIEDVKHRQIVDNYWNNSSDYERNHEMLIGFANDLEFTEEQIDNLFILANSL